MKGLRGGKKVLKAGHFKNIINKYKDLPVTAKASFWYLFCNIIQKALSMLTIPIITRMLATEEYGIYSVFISYSNIFIIFCTLSLYGNGYFVGMKKYSEDKYRYTSAMAGLMFTITTMLFIIFLLFQRKIIAFTQQNLLIFILMFAWIYGNGAMNLWFVENRYEFKYRLIVICTLLTAILTPALKVMLIFFFKKIRTDKSLGAITGYVFPIVLVGIIAWWIIVHKGKSVYVKEYWKFALSFNIPLIPYYLSQTILNQADRVMIERMDSAGAAGIYSVAYSLAMMISVINGAVNNTLIPWQFKTMEKGENKKVASTINLVMVIMAVMHLLLIFIAPEAMKIFAAEEYYAAIYVVPPVTVGILVMWLTQIFINIEFYYEKNKLIALSSVLSAILNIVLNVMVIPKFGYLAAGYTTLICYLINMLFHGAVVMILSKHNKKDRAFDLNKIILVVTGSIIAMWGALLSYEQPVVRYGIMLTVLSAILIKRKKLTEVISQMWKTVKGK